MKIKRQTLVTLFILFLFIPVKGQDTGIGAGIKIGQPTGLNMKLWLNKKNAFDFTLGYSFMHDKSRLYLSADYLFHSFNVFESEQVFSLYYGFGGRFVTKKHDDGSLGARGVIGVGWFSKQAPFDIFFELAPVFTIIPATDLDLDVCIGARYFFQ